MIKWLLSKLRARDPRLQMDKGGNNDLSRWEAFGGTLKRPALVHAAIAKAEGTTPAQHKPKICCGGRSRLAPPSNPRSLAMGDLTKAHKPKHISTPGHIDRVVCSCGWESAPYFDGAEYAAMEHRKHVATLLSALNDEGKGR